MILTRPDPPQVLVAGLKLRGRFIAERYDVPNVAIFGAEDWYELQKDPYVLGLARYTEGIPSGSYGLRMAVAGFLGVERVVVNLSGDRGVTLATEMRS